MLHVGDLQIIGSAMEMQFEENVLVSQRKMKKIIYH
jgi:hypothetical protein